MLISHSKTICSKFGVVRDDWHGFNVLQTAASRVDGLDIGFISGAEGMSLRDITEKSEVLFLFGADEIDIERIPKNTFVIYQGHHGDRGASRADVILPGAALNIDFN